MSSCFALFFPNFRSASKLREKAEASSIAENRFDRVSNGIADALKDHEDILEMGAAVEIRPDHAYHHFPIAVEVVAGRFALLSAHSSAPELPSMIGIAFLSLAHSKTPSFKNELICIPKYAKKSAK
ncbi:hypothetical protein V6N13_113609 [Hibiscus sabdariffa]|uniref:Uncharacterized protein n=1 Tax=Hibiscus sabdariffa TaxID=183260 RepID=A0ABR2TZZ4_9ROSI